MSAPFWDWYRSCSLSLRAPVIATLHPLSEDRCADCHVRNVVWRKLRNQAEPHGNEKDILRQSNEEGNEPHEVALAAIPIWTLPRSRVNSSNESLT